MQLGEYITHLQKIQREHGGALKCVYARDDEGNGFEEITYAPVVGNHDGEDFSNEKGVPINAICVN